MFQHKGDVECRNGFATGDASDPLCEFEKQRPPEDADCGEGTGAGGMRLGGCVSRYDFVRGALKLGLAEQRRIGINPYAFGIIASTDTHNGISGYTQEQAYHGHVGEVDDSPFKRLGEGDNLTHDTLVNNPGGLAGVWAEERSRDAIWEAMQRREVFGTSGPRIAVRLFGGWAFDAEICADPAWVTAADAAGVPMGSELVEAPASAVAPSFVVWAQADAGPPEHPGAPLQRLQIIKGWLDAAGDTHAKVFEVAGDPNSTASVDASTCEPQGAGADELCALWTDPEFDPSEPAFYYLRAVENPTCRWSTLECLRLAPADRPAYCNALPSPVKRFIQERAWSSPIWYQPPG